MKIILLMLSCLFVFSEEVKQATPNDHYTKGLSLMKDKPRLALKEFHLAFATQQGVTNLSPIAIMIELGNKQREIQNLIRNPQLNKDKLDKIQASLPSKKEVDKKQDELLVSLNFTCLHEKQAPETAYTLLMQLMAYKGISGNEQYKILKKKNSYKETVNGLSEEANMLFQLMRWDEAKKIAEKILSMDIKNHEKNFAAMVKLQAAAVLFEEADFEKIKAELQEQKYGSINYQILGQYTSIYNSLKTHFPEEQKRREEDVKKNNLPRVEIVTNKGTMLIELFEDEAPNTVANFISLVEKKFYDNILFHRVIPNFMIQGGDPNSLNNNPNDDGQGGPGYKFKDEFSENFRRHFRGSLSMANSGPDTNGSQFFICHINTPHLDKKHTVFGRVIKGLEIINTIIKGDKIISTKIIRKRDHEYKPQIIK